ncbi:hypothetical protein MesoLjLa_64600 (plasmid) [Mesorhizobium sp. L-2-11]|nr:hypothetical protein MesoLjLa_64600 [Mesorhizobium sp. L-2-11]
MLEQAGVAALVGGRANHKDIGIAEPIKEVSGGRIEFAQPPGLAERGAKILDVECGRGRAYA